MTAAITVTDDTTAVYTDAPTGPQLRLLRKLIDPSAVLTAVTTNRHQQRIICLLAGHEIDRRTVGALLMRGLIEERRVTDETSEYTLTDHGREWATGVRVERDGGDGTTHHTRRVGQ